MAHWKRAICLAGLAGTLTLGSGCANWISEGPDVIWDMVPGTEKLRLDETDIDGALVHTKLRFNCERRQYSVINIHETPYDGYNELVEVPVGIVAVPLSLVWFVVAEVVTLTSVSNEFSAGPIYWSAAALNPILPVEYGIWAWLGERWQRERVVEKKGTRKPYETSKPDPYDAVLPVYEGVAEVRFIDPRGEAGDRVDVTVGDETEITLNLLEVAEAIPSPRAQKLEIVADVQWSSGADPMEKTVELFLPEELVSKLYDNRELIARFLDGNDEERDAAEEELRALGYSREVAMILAKRD